MKRIINTIILAFLFCLVCPADLYADHSFDAELGLGDVAVKDVKAAKIKDGPDSQKIGTLSYSYGVSQGRVYVIQNSSFAARSAELLPFPGKSFGGAASAPMSNYFWATDNGDYFTGEGAALYTILPNEKTAVKIGSGYGPDPCDSGKWLKIREIGYNSDTAQLFGTDYRNLYLIDTVTGGAEFIASFGVGYDGNSIKNVWAMDYDPDLGTMIIVDQKLSDFGSRVSSYMYAIDPNLAATPYTIAVTPIGAVGTTGLTDILYSNISGMMYGCGNAIDRWLAVDTVNPSLTSLVSNIGHNMVGLGGEIDPGEGVGVTVSGYAEIDVSAEAKFQSNTASDSDHNYQWLEISDLTAAADLAIPESNDAQEVTVSSYIDGNSEHLEFGAGFESEHIGLETSGGRGSGNVTASYIGNLTIGTDGSYPLGSDGLMLIVEGTKLLQSVVLAFKPCWSLRVYKDSAMDDLLMELTDDDLPEGDSDLFGFMGALIVRAGDDYYLRFNADWNPDQMPFDLDDDGVVDYNDLAIFASHWVEYNCNCQNDWCENSDFDGDGHVDLVDFAYFASLWLSNESGNFDIFSEFSLNFYFSTIGIPQYGVYNDLCSDAIALAEGVTSFGSNIDATGTDISSCCYQDTKDVWYRFTPDANGACGIEVEPDGYYTSSVSIFDGCDGNELMCGYGDLFFIGEQDNTYYIRVAGYRESKFDFDITVNCYPEPGNDDCGDAMEIFMGQTYQETTFGATGDSTSECGNNDCYDVWYEYTTDANGAVAFKAEFDVPDESLTLALYDSCDGNEVACAEDYCDLYDEGHGTVVLSAALLPDTTYYLRVAVGDYKMGDFELSVIPPPDNDECDAAATIVLDELVYGSTVAATGDMTSSCGWGDDFYDVWYEFTPSTDMIVGFIGMRDIENPWDIPPMTVSLYDGCDGDELACAMDEGEPMGENVEIPDECALIVYPLEAFQSYKIRIAYCEESMGDFTLEAIEFQPPASDDCVDANEIYKDEWLYEESTFGATNDGTSDCGWGNEYDVWYKYTADANETLYFIAESMDWDKYITLSIFDGCDGNELNCDSSDWVEVEQEVEEGITYWIRVAFDEEKMGMFNIGVNEGY